MDTLQIKASKLIDDDIVIIVLNGILDGITLPELEKVTQRYLDEGIYNYIFDLAGLTRFSSAGTGFFISIVGVTSENSGGIVLLKPTTGTLGVLNIFGLTRYVPITDNLDRAVTLLTEPAKAHLNI